MLARLTSPGLHSSCLWGARSLLDPMTCVDRQLVATGNDDHLCLSACPTSSSSGFAAGGTRMLWPRSAKLSPPTWSEPHYWAAHTSVHGLGRPNMGSHSPHVEQLSRPVDGSILALRT